MLDDCYAEFLVSRQATIGLKILKFFAIVFSAFLLALGLLLSGYTYSISGFIGFAVCVGTFFLVKSWNVEYEYIFTSGELSIDKVIDQSRRKKVISMELSNVELVARYDSHAMDEYRNNQSIKVFDYSSKSADAVKYAIVYTDAANKGIYLFEPNEKMLKVMRNFAPRKIII